MWVKSDGLAVGRPLPVYSDKQTFSESVGTSQRCQYQTSTQVGSSFYGAIQTVFKLIWYGMDAEIEIKKKEAAN